jgi:hypothetical protein
MARKKRQSSCRPVALGPLDLEQILNGPPQKKNKKWSKSEHSQAGHTGPSNVVAGPSNVVAEPLNVVADPSHAAAGPSNAAAGLSNVVAEPSNVVAEPSHAAAGPSNAAAGPLKATEATRKKKRLTPLERAGINVSFFLAISKITN